MAPRGGGPALVDFGKLLAASGWAGPGWTGWGWADGEWRMTRPENEGTRGLGQEQGQRSRHPQAKSPSSSPNRPLLFSGTSLGLLRLLLFAPAAPAAASPKHPSNPYKSCLFPPYLSCSSPTSPFSYLPLTACHHHYHRSLRQTNTHHPPPQNSASCSLVVLIQSEQKVCCLRVVSHLLLRHRQPPPILYLVPPFLLPPSPDSTHRLCRTYHHPSTSPRTHGLSPNSSSIFSLVISLLFSIIRSQVPSSTGPTIKQSVSPATDRLTTKQPDQPSNRQASRDLTHQLPPSSCLASF